MKKKSAKKEKVDSIEKLAQLVAGGFADIDERFEKIDERFDKIDEQFIKVRSEMHAGFITLNKQMDRIETRISALEYAVFGVNNTTKQHSPVSWFDRIEKLEKVVFKK